MNGAEISIRNIYGIKELDLKFPESGLVAIQGKNGAGKSSLMDALTTAIFGEPTVARDVESADIIHSSSDKGTVSIEFEWDRQKYLISREFKRVKRGKRGEASSQSCVLHKVLSDGSLEGVATGPKAVNETVAGILASDRFKDRTGNDLVKAVKTAWMTSVFLPQGEITRFLRMEPSERQSLMSSLFRLEKGEMIKEQSKLLVEHAKKEMGELISSESVLTSMLSAETEESLETQKAQLEKIIEEMDEINSDLKKTEKKKILFSEFKSLFETSEKARLEYLNRENKHKEIQERFKYSRAKQLLQEIAAVGSKISKNLLKINHYHSIIDGSKEEHKKNSSFLKDKELAYKKLIERERTLVPYVAILPLLRSMDKINEELEPVKKQIIKLYSLSEDLASKKTFLDYFFIVKNNKNLLEKLSATEKSLEAAEAKYKQAGDKLKNSLIDWLSAISQDGEAVYIKEISSMDPYEFGKKMKQSGFTELIEEISVKKNRIDLISRELTDIKLELSEGSKNAILSSKKLRTKTGIKDIFFQKTEFLKLSIEEMVKMRSELSLKILEVSEKISRLESKREILERQRCQMAEQIKESVDSSIDTEKCNRLTEEYASVKQETVLINKDISLLRDRVSKSLSDMSSFSEKIGFLEEENKRLKADISGLLKDWKQAIKKWGLLEFKKMKGLSEIATENDLLSSETLLVNSRSRFKEENEKYEVFKGKNLLSSKDIACLDDCLDEINKDIRTLKDSYSRVLNNHSRLEQSIKTRERTEAKLKEVKKQKESIMPAYEYVKIIAKYMEGKQFGNFLQEKAMSTLLDKVNNWISTSDRYSKYSFSALGGNIFVDDGLKIRSTASLSGGEAVMVTMLLLKGIQMVSGMHGTICIDEGFAQLDSENLESVLRILEDFAEKSLIMVVTHDDGFAREFPTVWRFSKGEVSTDDEICLEKETSLLESYI